MQKKIAVVSVTEPEEAARVADLPGANQDLLVLLFSSVGVLPGDVVFSRRGHVVDGQGCAITAAARSAPSFRASCSLKSMFSARRRANSSR